MSRPTLLLPIEERNRELNSRILIVIAAVAAGFDVVLGQQWELFAHIDALPPSIILFKGDNTAQANWMKLAKRADHAVCSIEEEVFGISHEREILRCYDDQVRDVADLIFAQGTFQRDALLKRWPELIDRIVVVGNPRADILNRLGRDALSPTAARLRHDRGPFVLFNTNFASINPAIDDIYGYFELYVRVGMMHTDNPEDMHLLNEQFAWERGNFDAVLTLVLRLARDGVKIVLRPHPSENADLWRRQLADVPGVQVADQGDQLDWLKASTLMVHSGCTTGLEAFLMNHPVVALTPGDSVWHGVLTSNIVNTTYPDLFEAEAAIKQHLAVSQRLNQDRYEAAKRLDRYLAMTPIQPSAEKIVGILRDRFADMPRQGKSDLSVLRSSGQTHLSVRRLGKVAFEQTDIERAIAAFEPASIQGPQPKNLISRSKRWDRACIFYESAMRPVEPATTVTDAVALRRAAVLPGPALAEAVQQVWRVRGADAVGRALRLAIAEAPGQPALLTLSAHTFFNQERWDASAIAARWAAITHPDAPNAHMLAAAHLFRARRYDEALIHVDQAIARAASAAGPRFLKGRALVALGAVDDGMRRIAEAARLDPNYRNPARIMRHTLTVKDFERVKASVPSTAATARSSPDS